MAWAMPYHCTLPPAFPPCMGMGMGMGMGHVAGRGIPLETCISTLIRPLEGVFLLRNGKSRGIPLFMVE